MAEPVHKTLRATQDLEELAAYYLMEAGVNVALRFIDSAERACEQLSYMPMMGALLGFAQAPYADIRRWHIEGFDQLLILYRTRPDGIEVVRVLHGARDIEPLFHNPT